MVCVLRKSAIFYADWSLKYFKFTVPNPTHPQPGPLHPHSTSLQRSVCSSQLGLKKKPLPFPLPWNFSLLVTPCCFQLVQPQSLPTSISSCIYLFSEPLCTWSHQTFCIWSTERSFSILCPFLLYTIKGRDHALLFWSTTSSRVPVILWILTKCLLSQ